VVPLRSPKRLRTGAPWLALLCNQFQPADYNDRLFDEIRRRTQGPDESIAMFAAVMDNMFDRVTVRVPEATRLKIILKNLARAPPPVLSTSGP
jgi:hypothetical protein